MHGCLAGKVCMAMGKKTKPTLVFRQISIINIGSDGSIYREGLSDIFCKNDILNDQRQKDYTKGDGVDVVYDSIGKDTFPGSLDCLKPLGMWVSFGQSSGSVPEFKITLLSQKGSLFLTRPSLVHYTAKRSDLLAAAAELFEVVQKGAVKISVNQTFALKDAVAAHQALEGRKTTGSTLLLP